MAQHVDAHGSQVYGMIWDSCFFLNLLASGPPSSILCEISDRNAADFGFPRYLQTVDRLGEKNSAWLAFPVELSGLVVDTVIPAWSNFH